MVRRTWSSLALWYLLSCGLGGGGCAGADDTAAEHVIDSCEGQDLVCGERAATGTCPAGEQCDPNSTGLLFIDAVMGVDAFIAAPGEMGMLLVQKATDLNISLGFVARADGVLSVSQDNTASVTVRAEQPGDGYLRIFNTSDELIDRIALRAGQAQSLAIEHGWEDPWSSSRPIIAMPGVELDVHARFGGELGARLIDESIRWSPPPAVSVDLWHPTDAKLSSNTAGVHEIVVEAGGLTVVTAFEVVSSIDQLEELSSDQTSRTLTASGGHGEVCMVALNRGRQVAAVPFQVQAGPGLTVHKPELDSTSLKRCSYVQASGDTLGPSWVRLSVGSAMSTVEFDIVE